MSYLFQELSRDIDLVELLVDRIQFAVFCIDTDPLVKLTLQKGETVRLRVTNRGAVLHELVIGTPKELAEHAEMMRKFPGMEHDAPHMAHVKPGRNGEIVWQFTQPGEFQFACLIPGHFEAGMVGKVVVK